MANFELEYPYTPEWGGNRKKGNHAFTVWLRDVTAESLEKANFVERLATLETNRDIRQALPQLKEAIQSAVSRVEGFSYGGKEIRTAEDLFSSPLNLLLELVARWANGRPAEEESKNLPPSSG